MKFKKIKQLISLLGFSSIITTALASCAPSVSDQQPSNRQKETNTPIVGQLNELATTIEAKDIVLKDKNIKDELASKITNEDLNINLDNKFNDFNPVFEILEKSDKEGKIKVKLHFVSKTDENTKTDPITLDVVGFKTTNQQLAPLVFENQQTKSINLGDANWETYEYVTKNVNEMFKKRFANVPELKGWTIKGEFEVKKAPEKNENNDVVITLSGANNSKIWLTNNKQGDELVQLEINSLKVANVKPTQVSLKAWNGEVESTNAYERYKNDKKQLYPTYTTIPLIEEDPNKEIDVVGTNSNGRIQVPNKYRPYNKDNLSININSTKWIIDPITVPKKGETIDQYSILATVKFGENGTYWVTDAYRFQIFAKKFYFRDLDLPYQIIMQPDLVRKGPTRITNRDSIVPEVFSLVGPDRTNVSLFLLSELDRSKLQSFLTYGDQFVEGKYDNSLNVPTGHGNKMFSLPLENGGKSKNMLDPKSTNYIFAIGYSNNKPDSKLMFNKNLTFLNIKYMPNNKAN
ncbi:lipoprotein 17-related variable surface protein [Mycoplasma sp. E35C]|uniref:lipoprotein 17-related variable surface protein n=1 Tax=Mycoplasma sp. E35C TaxID=2801918 RepID=UPI001CA3D205|nr:lipoprotein 17-related variable surface protein [Mycoplasma sp. E35C]QZX49266.1 hypothetical protein JJE79_00665 [Mycoplasma sp. E35C]